jgi:hypothetical protein
MNPAPGTSWPDLHYIDDEQVELDVSAIIARGTRLRRQRLITKIAVAAVVVAVAPVAVVVHARTSVTSAHEPMAGVAQGHGVKSGQATSGTFAPAAGGPAWAVPYKSANAPAASDFGDARSHLMFSFERAVVRHATTLQHGYGPVLAVAGARAGSGLWFTAMSAQLTLFHLSTAGALKSWPLPMPAVSVRANGGTGLAVTAAGLAWIGVGSTLVSIDTRTSKVSTWQVPAQPPPVADTSMADSVAVSPDGRVAVVTSHSRAVRVLDPRAWTFRQVRLPSAADQPLVVGYARDGTLAIGYRRRGQPHAGSVLLVDRKGAERSIAVPQPAAVAAYGTSGLLVGVTERRVVWARGHPRALALPVNSPDIASVTTAPVPLPGDRLGIATNSVILTFPARTASSPVVTTQSELWITPPQRCRARQSCPAGYQLLATDSDGNLWVVPRAHPRTVELVSLR